MKIVQILCVTQVISGVMLRKGRNVRRGRVIAMSSGFELFTVMTLFDHLFAKAGQFSVVSGAGQMTNSRLLQVSILVFILSVFILSCQVILTSR